MKGENIYSFYIDIRNTQEKGFKKIWIWNDLNQIK